MRIDFQYTPQPAEPGKSQAQNHETQRPAGAAGAPLGAPLGASEDQAQLSAARTQVEALAAQASQLPEIRQARLESLRQAVGSGQYRADAVKVAGALLNSLLAARPASRG